MNTNNRLLYSGLVLFLLALLTGLLLVASPPFVANPRGVMSGHVEATMNGMFLMIVGLFFNRVRLSPGLTRACTATLLYATFANWAFSTLAGILGTSNSTPIAGAGYHASALAEQLILAGLVSVALTTLVGVSLLLVGLRRGLTAVPAPAAFAG